eukprot:scaffold24803_cov87-Skeletonema_marinoi.AAC.1
MDSDSDPFDYGLLEGGMIVAQRPLSTRPNPSVLILLPFSIRYVKLLGKEAMSIWNIFHRNSEFRWGCYAMHEIVR